MTSSRRQSSKLLAHRGLVLVSNGTRLIKIDLETHEIWPVVEKSGIFRLIYGARRWFTLNCQQVGHTNANVLQPSTLPVHRVGKQKCTFYFVRLRFIFSPLLRYSLHSYRARRTILSKFDFNYVQSVWIIWALICIITTVQLWSLYWPSLRKFYNATSL